ITAVQPGKPPREREPEARALLRAVDSGIDLLELVEDPSLVALGDANACVGDRDLDGVLEPLAIDAHRPAGGGELDRIRNEVEQHLLELARVGLDVADAIAAGFELDLLLGSQRLDR